jgi:uncharacterized coiled-coil protein SlyX
MSFSRIDVLLDAAEADLARLTDTCDTLSRRVAECSLDVDDTQERALIARRVVDECMYEDIDVQRAAFTGLRDAMAARMAALDRRIAAREDLLAARGRVSDLVDHIHDLLEASRDVYIGSDPEPEFESVAVVCCGGAA